MKIGIKYPVFLDIFECQGDVEKIRDIFTIDGSKDIKSVQVLLDALTEALEEFETETEEREMQVLQSKFRIVFFCFNT